MKQHPVLTLSIVLVIVTTALLAGGAAMPAKSMNIRGVGFQTPESVVYDAAADVYLVSNINGGAAAATVADDNGFISRVSPAGRVLRLKWIDGARGNTALNAPKGMAIVGDTLYVADITMVRMFDRRTGLQKATITIAGSTFLNDVAAGPDDSVYVTDSGLKPDFSPSGTDAIYKIDKRGRVTAIARGGNLKGPNGIMVLPDGRVFVVTFSQTGETYSVDKNGYLQGIKRLPKGQLDGVERTRSGALLISS